MDGYESPIVRPVVGDDGIEPNAVGVVLVLFVLAGLVAAATVNLYLNVSLYATSVSVM